MVPVRPSLSSPLLIAAVIFSNCLYIEHGSQEFKRLNINLTPLLKHSDLLVCCGTDSAVSCYSFSLLKMSYSPKLQQFTFLHTSCDDLRLRVQQTCMLRYKSFILKMCYALEALNQILFTIKNELI